MNAYPQTLTFKAQNWTGKNVEVTMTSETEFTVEGNDFRIGKTVFDGEPTERFYFESVEIFSLAHDTEHPSFYATRFPNDNDKRYAITDGDIVREADTVVEVMALIVAMCF